MSAGALILFANSTGSGGNAIQMAQDDNKNDKEEKQQLGEEEGEGEWQMKKSAAKSTNRTKNTGLPGADGIKFVLLKFHRVPAELPPQLDANFLAWKKKFWQEKMLKDGIKNVLAPMVDQRFVEFLFISK